MQSNTFRPSKGLRLLAGIAAFCLLLSLISGHFPGARAEESSSSAAFAASDFQRVWQESDGPVASGQVSRSWLWGPTPGATLNETFAGVPGGTRLVQYFDKGRMELNSAISDTASIWRVTTGLLVTEMVEGKIQTGADNFVQSVPSDQVIAGDAGAAGNPRYVDFTPLVAKKATDKTGSPVTELLPASSKPTQGIPSGVGYAKFVPETSHNIAGVFWSYMTQPSQVGDQSSAPLFDWLYVMGYPITEPVWANVVISGAPQPVLIQLFQRRVLTYVPSYTKEWQVQMGNAGQHYYNWRYGGANPAAKATQTPAPTSSASQAGSGVPSDAFVHVSGANFVYGGSKVTLKGTNYWLSDDPFIQTWVGWDAPQIKSELDKARQLGVNTIRIGIPYDHHDTRDIIWGNRSKMISIAPRINSVMNQFLEIASSYNMKVIFVLFDWYDPFVLGGKPDEQTNLTYLKGIVGPFVNDDRVLAWDVYNEPDFSQSWEGGHQSDFIYWLHDVAQMVKSIDPRHPVTLGIGNYTDLWLPAGNGTTILSFVDFVALHCYDAGALTGQIEAIKARTTEPILLEEMGWPTALGGEAPTPNATFDEATQTFLYKTMLAASNTEGIAGVMQWTLWDYWGSNTAFVPGHERFFGLVKADGSFKPAADIFKNNYTSPPLPSNTQSNVPLDTAAKPKTRP